MQETLRTLSNRYVMEKIRRGDEQFSNGTFNTHDLVENETIFIYSTKDYC